MKEYISHPLISKKTVTPRLLITITSLITLIYFTWWLNINNAGNPVLYGLLFVGEIFHVWQALGYAYTIWDQSRFKFRKIIQYWPVDVFVTVCGEPVEVVEKTLKAIFNMKYPNFKVYILNDGKSRNKDNWKEIDELAIRYGATPITRERNWGNKAGNINNALRQSKSPFIVVFDCDHIPNSNFLLRTMGYFEDPKVSLVQTPQYYENKSHNELTRAAWEQQELFFGPICKGKNRLNSTFWCGTNAVVRREALNNIGGIPENNIAEDFLASLFMHQKGWKSVYVPEILARGLAPLNLGDYVNQQFRWARGSLEIMFKYNPLFRRGLSFGQRMQYLYSSGYYLNGVIILIDALIPLIVLTTDILPVNADTSSFMVYFFPFIFSTIFLLMVSTNHQISFRAIQMSMSSFYVFLTATIAAIFNIKSPFRVTSKSQESGNYLKLVIPHFIYIALTIVSVSYALNKHGLVPSVVTNSSWAVFNIVFFFGYIKLAYPWALVYSRTMNLIKEIFSIGIRNEQVAGAPAV